MKMFRYPRVLRELAIATAVLGVLFVLLFRGYNVIVQQFEAAAVADAESLAGRDAQRLADFWANTEARVARTWAVAARVTLAQRHGDQVAMDLALHDLNLMIGTPVDSILLVVGLNDQGAVNWTSSPSVDLGFKPSGMDYVDAILKQGRNSFVGVPAIGRTSGKWRIAFAEAVREQGKLVGIVNVSFELERAKEITAQLLRYPNDVVSLVRDHSTTLARSNGVGVGGNADATRTLFRRKAADGLYHRRGPSSIDGVNRIVVGADVPHSQLSVVVGVEEAAVLAETKIFADRLRASFLMVALTLCLLAIAIVVAAEYSRQSILANSRLAAEAARRKLDEELEATRQDLHTMLSSAPGWLFRAEVMPNGESRLVSVSPAGSSPLGHSMERWATPGFLRSIAHQTAIPTLDRMRGEMREHGEASGEILLRDAKGDYRWLSLISYRKRTYEPGFTFVGYGFDITEQKETADSLAKAEKLLNLGFLAAGVGHELGQPLAAISLAAGSGELALQKGEVGIERARQKFERIMLLTERAAAIIDAMTIAGGQPAGRVSSNAVAKLVSEAVALAQTDCEAEGVSVEVLNAANTSSIRVSDVLFERVLINLIRNAVDAYREKGSDFVGRKAIWISTSEIAGKVVISIRDQAGGIAPELMERIFEPFVTTKAPGLGQGLGLSICFNIIREAGGTITVENEAGGAVFNILMPAERVEIAVG